MINVLIVDDHPAVGEGTKAMIEQEADMKAHVITPEDITLDFLKERKYDVYLIDLYMPKINGIELTKLILHEDPDAIVLIYTGFDLISHFNLLIDAGIAGFLNKTATKEQLITSIKCALREEAVVPLPLLKQLRRVKTEPTTNKGKTCLGDISLSNKEQEILEGISRGLTNKAIALEMSMSQRTVEYNLTKIFSKLKVASRTEALLKAREFGLLPPQYTDNKENS